MAAPLLSTDSGAPRRDVIVGVADMKVHADPSVCITTYALGSCLGITFYDPIKKVGGMLHAMLPDSALHQGQTVKIPMFVDTGVVEVLNGLKQLGASTRSLECKVFGGAQVVSAEKFFKIGDRNTKAFREIATRLGLNVTVWEVGGQGNRTIKLFLDSGKVSVRMPSQPVFWK